MVDGDVAYPPHGLSEIDVESGRLPLFEPLERRVVGIASERRLSDARIRNPGEEQGR